MRDRSRLLLLLGFGLLAAITLMPTVGYTRPEFAARMNVACIKCHYNPMGGGMRNDKGADSTEKLSLEVTKNWLEKKYPDYTGFDPALNDTIRMGADMRLLWYDLQKDKEKPNPSAASTFYAMQAALYANARVNPILQVNANYDMAQNTFEAWGMVDNLPAGLYFKAGRFMLPYGLRVDDHTIFTRETLGFGPLSYDTGVEVGIAPGPFFLTAALTNGLLGTQAPDADADYYAVTGQTGVRFWKIGLGASAFHNVRDGYTYDVYGPWFTFGIWQITLMGEFDAAFQQVDNVADPTKEDRIASAGSFIQGEVKVIDGLYLNARYSHYDPDMEVDENFVDQTMAGVTFYPMPHFHTVFQYRMNREAEPLKVNNDEVVIQGHFFF